MELSDGLRKIERIVYCLGIDVRDVLHKITVVLKGGSRVLHVPIPVASRRTLG